MTPMRPVICLIVLSAACLGMAQTGLSGKDRFPQFRGLSGLPGAGFGVTGSGKPSFSGAMSYSTPIGHTLGGWSIAAGAGTISRGRNLVFFNSESGSLDKVKGNGTAFFVVGLDLEKYGSLSGGFTFLSGVGDNISSLQYSPRSEEKIQFSIGCQDLGGSGGSSGTNVEGDGRSSRSFYGAATYQAAEGVYLSAGIGTRRFQKGFGSISSNVGRNFKLVAEHDGWGLNYGVAFSPGPLGRTTSWGGETLRTAELTLFFGIVQNKYAAWSLVASF